MLNYYTSETIQKIRKGYYSAIYFWRTKEILEKDGNTKTATMQIFQRHEVTICGINEVVELLKVGTGYWDKESWVDTFNELKIQSLSEGNKVKPLESVMLIEGPYHTFAHLESIYLGILARRTLVTSNVNRAVTAAGGKPVIFFADRFDHFLNQEGDGYAAKIGGAAGVATPAQAISFAGKASGTMPHALIALFDGDTILATEKFLTYNPSVNLIALVDFDNDVVKTALAVAHKFGRKVWGVRVDTSFDMIDKSLVSHSRLDRESLGDPRLREDDIKGVNPYLVKNLRRTLDKTGFNYVKIVASGGFDDKKMLLFEKERTPVDVYGVGSALLKGENDFTSDIVAMEGKRVSKEGRRYTPNPRLVFVK